MQRATTSSFRTISTEHGICVSRELIVVNILFRLRISRMFVPIPVHHIGSESEQIYGTLLIEI